MIARYSSTSPRSLFAPGLLAREQLAVVREVALERHDVAVGVVLREREVQEVAGLLGRVAAHEVDGHVVGGAERRRQRVGAAAREPCDLIERHVRVPEHDDVADVVDPASAGAPRELRVLARREELVVLTRELRQLLDHDRPFAGRSTPTARRKTVLLPPQAGSLCPYRGWSESWPRIRFDDTGQQAQIPDFGAPFSAPANL